MANVTLNPYINLNDGKAEEALEFYKSIFGGQLTISRYSDAPPNPAMPVTEGQKSMVMHGQLDADHLTLMVGDADPMGGTKMGDNVSVSLSGDDETTLRQYYDALCEGGQVVVPLAVAPWGDTFGMVDDKFGIHWLVNISAKG